MELIKFTLGVFVSVGAGAMGLALYSTWKSEHTLLVLVVLIVLAVAVAMSAATFLGLAAGVRLAKTSQAGPRLNAAQPQIGQSSVVWPELPVPPTPTAGAWHSSRQYDLAIPAVQVEPFEGGQE